MFPYRHASLIVALGLALAGCEGAKNNSSWSTRNESEPILPLLTTDTQKEDALTPTTQAPAEGAAAGASGPGVGPVDQVDITSLGSARALAGAELFKVKCLACHKIEERYIGPALAGITKRRQPEWILNMILNPEIMIQQDPTAKALLAEFIAPMVNQNLTREEAESILAYFLQHDGPQRAAAEKPASGTEPAKSVTQ